MRAKPGNWKDCSMFVQDPVNPYVNITAEIPTEVVKAFRECCRQFTKMTVTRKNAILPDIGIDIEGIRSFSAHDVHPIANKNNNNINKTFAIDDLQHHSNSSFTIPSFSEGIFDIIEYEVSHLLHRSEHRIKSEKQIIDIVSAHMKSENSRFDVHTFGSSTYGFGDSVDLNILIDTGI